MTIDWLKATPWIIAAVCAAGAATAGYVYMQERDEFTTYRATSEQAGKDAKARETKLKADHADNLKQVRKDYEDQIPAIRSAAVAAYKLRYPTSGSGLCATSTSKPVDDGASKKLLVDPKFVEDCGDDAAKLTAWQDLCKRNNCPVGD